MIVRFWQTSCTHLQPKKFQKTIAGLVTFAVIYRIQITQPRHKSPQKQAVPQVEKTVPENVTDVDKGKQTFLQMRNFRSLLLLFLCLFQETNAWYVIDSACVSLIKEETLLNISFRKNIRHNLNWNQLYQLRRPCFVRFLTFDPCSSD